MRSIASSVVAQWVVTFWILGVVTMASEQRSPISFEQYLRESAVEKGVIDTFLDPNQLSWARFDTELGYALGNYLPQDGLDGSSTISTAGEQGPRTAHLYTDRACRINTYGNSFTQCHQVSDGETWQEYLAAHLGEPIRNFGMGGYGVYQAYRRMLREEQGERDAEYVILYVWGDDHLRSLLRCRHALIYKWWDHDGGRMFHNPFWAHVEMDLETGQIVEHENLLSSPESLYQMTDPDWMYGALKDDLALQMYLYASEMITDLDWPKVDRLAEHLELSPPDRGTAEKSRESVRGVLNKYGFAATRYILTKTREFTNRSGKKLLVILFDPSRVTRSLINTGTRYDQEIVDFLRQEEFPYFDMNLVHVEDFKAFRISLDEYMRRYFIGHYSPAGNHFFAFSLKDTLVEWLDPKPITYRKDAGRMEDFKTYVK